MGLRVANSLERLTVMAGGSATVVQWMGLLAVAAAGRPTQSSMGAGASNLVPNGVMAAEEEMDLHAPKLQSAPCIAPRPGPRHRRRPVVTLMLTSTWAYIQKMMIHTTSVSPSPR